MQLQILGHWWISPFDAVGACSSYVVNDRQTTCLLDCGAGTLPLLQARNLIPKLDAIVISHMDHDHYLDLAPLANTLLKQSHNGKIQLYVPSANGPKTLQEAADLLFAGDNRFAKAFQVIGYDAEDNLTIGSLHLTFVETVHSTVCYSPRISNGDQTIVYSADTAYFPAFSRHAQGADLLLCEATVLQEHPAHLTGEQAGQIAAEAGVGRLILTHLGYDPAINEQNRQNAQKKYKGVVDLAATGAEYRV